MRKVSEKDLQELYYKGYTDGIQGRESLSLTGIINWLGGYTDLNKRKYE